MPCFVEPKWGVCRLQVAIKLALLQSEDGLPEAALSTLQPAIAAAEHARSAASDARAGSAQERFCHITASRSVPHAAHMAAVAALSDADQNLAHLHADAVQLLTECELQAGIKDGANAAKRASAKAAAQLQRRKEQVALCFLFSGHMPFKSR